MKPDTDDVQYTVRGIPVEVDRALRRMATARKVSLNRIIVDELTADALAECNRADFGDLAGKWVSDPSFDEIISAQRQIDPDKWA